ncbi:hypothetical protein [Paraburkholderia fungorum]|uniref:Uncharacterized protein n=1 Tax=Paraburkholderia fungorum TaxID=134537 RepID=A0A420FRP5_9BURK|nr:hypothetical protein [Paraburkholderia fungorum]RKF35656.1 hypothetical protein BCY88_08370 [Paraburkholderia fungorum]
MRSTSAFSVRAFACLVSLGVLTYGTRGLASHQHLHIAYLALTAVGVITGALFTSTWSLKA